MTTPADSLRQMILTTLAAVHPQPVRLQELYGAVEDAITFDSEDLAPVEVRGAPTAEPSWKRNVRNVLQQGKRSGTLVNIAYEAWRLPTPDADLTLNEDEAWEEVRSAAENALHHAVVYRSTKRDHGYRLL